VEHVDGVALFVSHCEAKAMNLILLLDRARRLPLDARYALLVSAKQHFKPHSVDMKHLVREIKKVNFRRLRKELRAA